MKYRLIPALSLLFITLTIHPAEKPSKIVGMIPVRNEPYFIEQCLRSLAYYTDAIVVLDDSSEDDTVAVVKSLQKTCNIELIIEKGKEWLRDEATDRNLLLQAGRTIGGTHFIFIDADEMISANCAKNNALREAILQLKPADKLVLPFFNLWESVYNYRANKDVYWGPGAQALVFCDDGVCCFIKRGLYHVNYRIPLNIKGGSFIRPKDSTFALLHFQPVNLRRVQAKQAWYRCLEHIRSPGTPVDDINKSYSGLESPSPVRVEKCLMRWFDGYDFFDPELSFKGPLWHEEQVLAWFDQFGKEYFADLNIWDLDWESNAKS